jgi:mitogen-activated protein kinase kinase kinase 9
MEALRHPNIVMFLGACTKPPHFAIVLEYCEGGTIWALLQKQSQELSWDERRDLALDVARGMNYLHERNTPILHRDLKSLNLLLDHKRRVKLADFGWTKGLQNYMTGKIGTYQWMAPEVISAYQYT